MGNTRSNVAIGQTLGASSYLQDALGPASVSGVGNLNVQVTGNRSSAIAQGYLTAAGGGGYGQGGQVTSTAVNNRTNYAPVSINTGWGSDALKALTDMVKTTTEAGQPATGGSSGLFGGINIWIIVAIVGALIFMRSK